MKFKLDENLGRLGKSLLEAAGHDVMTIADQQMMGTEDERVFEICRREARVLVTLDHDFGQTLRFPPELTAGIVVIECKGRLTPKMILARMHELAAALKIQPVDGELWIVEPGRIRIHERKV